MYDDDGNDNYDDDDDDASATAFSPNMYFTTLTLLPLKFTVSPIHLPLAFLYHGKDRTTIINEKTLAYITHFIR